MNAHCRVVINHLSVRTCLGRSVGTEVLNAVHYEAGGVLPLPLSRRSMKQGRKEEKHEEIDAEYQKKKNYVSP